MGVCWRPRRTVATNVFRAPVLSKYRLSFQHFPRDLHMRRNMTTTSWVDTYTSIAANNVIVSMESNGDAVAAEDVMASFDAIKDTAMKSAATRYAVVAGPDCRMWLELQSLPGSAETLSSKPTFAG